LGRFRSYELNSFKTSIPELAQIRATYSLVFNVINSHLNVAEGISSSWGMIYDLANDS
jgi:hypothetical protein